MKSFIKTVSDEIVSEAKDFGRIAKKQITGNNDTSAGSGSDINNTSDKVDKTRDPITGKKPPTKQQLSDLKNQTAQLQMVKLKKVREELEKQRLKVSGQQPGGSGQEVGPEVKHDDKAPKDDAVAKALKGSKSTGEFKGLIGG